MLTVLKRNQTKWMACKCISKLSYSGLEIIVRSNEKVYWGEIKFLLLSLLLLVLVLLEMQYLQY